MRILIAEDDHTSRIALAGVLARQGHEVTAVDNGAAAWAVLQRPDAPRLAILDWMMPELDGLEVLRQTRSLRSEQPPYILLLTARDAKADIITGLDAGANDYLAKPFDTGELRARVEVGRRMIEMQDALWESRRILAHQATHDSLTGLFNRRAILDHLNRELARTRRCGGFLAVGMCDIDRFKQVNDTYGHQTGDDLLTGLARMLTVHMREYDAVGRTGGEEFLIVSPAPSVAEGRALFERVREMVARTPIATRSGPLVCTLSIGVACTPPGLTLDRILETADSALYRAKHHGRNRVVAADRSLCEEYDHAHPDR